MWACSFFFITSALAASSALRFIIINLLAILHGSLHWSLGYLSIYHFLLYLSVVILSCQQCYTQARDRSATPIRSSLSGWANCCPDALSAGVRSIGFKSLVCICDDLSSVGWFIGGYYLWGLHWSRLELIIQVGDDFLEGKLMLLLFPQGLLRAI